MPGFSDVLGHEQTIAHMKSAIEANKVSHAYLLAGEKGSGKKMLAGIFARTLQCEAHGSEPCGKCHSCIQAESGNQPDINRDGLVAADTLNFALLNRTQQTNLHHRRDIANFIEKQRAAIGNFKTTTMGINRTSKRPFVMTE